VSALQDTPCLRGKVRTTARTFIDHAGYSQSIKSAKIFATHHATHGTQGGKYCVTKLLIVKGRTTSHPLFFALLVIFFNLHSQLKLVAKGCVADHAMRGRSSGTGQQPSKQSDVYLTSPCLRFGLWRRKGFKI